MTFQVSVNLRSKKRSSLHIRIYLNDPIHLPDPRASLLEGILSDTHSLMTKTRYRPCSACRYSSTEVLTAPASRRFSKVTQHYYRQSHISIFIICLNHCYISSFYLLIRRISRFNFVSIYLFFFVFYSNI